MIVKSTFLPAKLALAFACILLFLPTIFGQEPIKPSPQSDYFDTIEEEVEARMQHYLDTYQPKSCYTMEIEENLGVPADIVIDNTRNLLRSGAGTWNLTDGYGSGCTNDCGITNATSCGGSAVYRIPLVYTVSTTTSCGNSVPSQTELDAQVQMMNDFLDCENVPIEFFKSTTYTGHPTTGDMSTRYADLGCTYNSNNVTNLPNVVNIYVFYNTGNGSGCNGFAFLPTSTNSPTVSVMSRGCYNGFTYTAGSLNCGNPALGAGVVLIHEMGHYLGLHHTHEPSGGQECPDGSNSCTTGDYIADTDADPDLSAACAAGSGCDKDPSGCTSPCGTPYPEDINTENNIMSYNNLSGCRNNYTECQKAKMVDALLCARGPQMCSRDVSAEFASASNGPSLEICLGDPAPTFTATSSCYSWYDGLGSSATQLATNVATFTPTIGTGTGQLDNNTIGVYTWYLGDLNEINPDCRTTLTVTVLPETGTATANGSPSFSTSNCSSASTVNLTTDVTALGTDNVIGWWITETNPITTTVTNNATLTTALSNVTIGGTLSNPVDNLFESTSGTPLKEYTLSFDCSTLNPGLNYYAVPVVATSRAAIPDVSCSANNGSVNNITFNGQPGKFTSIAPASIPCVPNPVMNPPTYTLDVTVSGYTGDPNELGMVLRENNFNGTTMYLSFTLAGNGTYSFDQTDFPGYDPGNPGGSVGLTAVAWEQTGNGMQNGSVSMSLNITYPGTPAIPFPSITSYSNCLFGNALQLSCNCASNPILAVTATDATKNEGDSGNTPFTFTVTRTGSTSGATTVDYAVTGSGTDPANATDFGGALPSGTVSFADTETSKVVTINVSGDTDIENDEGFTVTLSNPSGAATISMATATGTIQNDDLPPPTLAIAATDANKAEGNTGTTPFTFTVTRSGNTSGTSSASWAVTGSGADPADATDFGGSLPSGTVNFAASSTSETITVNVNGDTDVEPDEGFTVTLSSPTGATITTAAATGTIQNDDAPPSYCAAGATSSCCEKISNVQFNTINNPSTSTAGYEDFTGISTSVAKGSTHSFTGTISNGYSTDEIIVWIDFNQDLDFEDAGEEVYNSDIGVGPHTGNITIPATAMTGNTRMRVRLHDTAIGPETSPCGDSDYGQVEDYTINITEADPNIAISGNPSQNEGDSGTTAFSFTVTRTGNTSGTSTANWAVTGSGTYPANAIDFGGSLPSGTVNFAASSTSETITVDVSGDTDFENNEGFTVTLSSPVNATITTATATGTIQNDDCQLLTWYQDNDMDNYGNPAVSTMACTKPAGYVADNTDCDDGDANEFPGQTWYLDADGDDYSEGTSLTACERPANHYTSAELTATSGDCNDGNAAVNPGATEVCNGVDDDCDTMVDEGVTTTYYADPDADGFGDPATSTEACTQPAGYVTNNTDNCPSIYNPDQDDDDSNGEGDICQNCPPNLTIYSYAPNQMTFQAQQNLMTSGAVTIPTGTARVYKAGTSTTLNANFEVQLGGELDVQVETCTPVTTNEGGDQ